MISPVKIWRKQDDIRRILGKSGKIISWTKIIVAGSDFKSFAPYYVALVELKGGERVSGPLVDVSEKGAAIGAQVTATLRKVRQTTEEDVIAYGIKFKPL